MSLEIIDIHPHIIAPDEARYPVQPIGGERSAWSLERPVSLEGLVDEMDAAMIAKAAIVHSSTVYGFDNSYVMDSVAGRTDRFVAVCSVDMRSPQACEEIEALAKRSGMGGLRLFTTGSTMPGQRYVLDDPSTYEAWECAQAHGLPICLQMTADAIPDLLQLVERFPATDILLDHLARPRLEDGPPYAAARSLFELADHPRIFLKVTPKTIALASQGDADPHSFFSLVVERFGADRLAWGSNFPNDVGSLTQLRDGALEALSPLDDADLARVMGGTAKRIYRDLAS